MNDSTSLAQVALLFLLLLIPLVQLLVPALRRRLEELAKQADERQEEAASPTIVVRTVAAPRADVAKPRTTRTPPPARTATPLPERRRWRGRSIDLREARRGMVIMAVLGPCRALESPGQRGSENLP